MFSIVSCRIFISSSHFYWFENGEGVDRSLCYTNKVNFIVLSSFIMKYALEGCYSVCVICVLRQNWNCSVNLTVYFFFLSCLTFYCLMKEACFFNCGENLSVKGMTYLTNSLFDYRSPENNSIRAEFILDAAHHKVRELHLSYQKISSAL